MGRSLSHAVGTAAISPREAPWGVLDPDLRVKGTAGLRVIDASALPYVPSGHSKFSLQRKGPYLIVMKAQGPVYLLAEVAAGKIKAGW